VSQEILPKANTKMGQRVGAGPRVAQMEVMTARNGLLLLQPRRHYRLKLGIKQKSADNRLGTSPAPQTRFASLALFVDYRMNRDYEE
jgi:hypothetical protein